MEKIIEVLGLSFSYTDEEILKNVSFTVSKGDFLSIIGSNGAGKSTLLKLLLNIIKPQRGAILYFGEDIEKFKGWQKIGYVPQNAILNLDSFPATVLEIATSGLYSQKIGMKERKKIAREYLSKLGVLDLEKSLIGKLSGGQKQRVMLARTLAANPEILILDEPMAGVDQEASQNLYGLLKDLNEKENLTIRMVTHDLLRASNFSKRVLCLEEGSLVELDRKQIEHELFHKHKHP